MQFYHSGRVVAISIGFGIEHFAVISGTTHMGEALLISRRAAKGGVTEEGWGEVVGSRGWRFATELERVHPPHIILARAKSLVGEAGYNLFTRNCEHFVRWAAGLKQESVQAQAAVGLALATCLFLLLKRGRA